MNQKWWKAAGVRAVKTMAQTAIATIGAAAVLSAVQWPVVASATVLAGGGVRYCAGRCAVPADLCGRAAGSGLNILIGIERPGLSRRRQAGSFVVFEEKELEDRILTIL